MQNPRGMDYAADGCASPDGSTPVGIADFSTAFHASYRAKVAAFLAYTTQELLETDGPYEGATCAVTPNSGFAHVNNSQHAQWAATAAFYRQLKATLNTYLNVPDPYYSSGGTNRQPMGYTDAWNRNLPHTPEGNAEHLRLGRKFLSDGTEHLPTTAGWMDFEFERTPPPMDTHTELLEEMFASYLGQGNIAMVRGPYLYDEASPRVRELWRLWVAHYKRYRRILSADAVHALRPTGDDIEASVHVNASAAAGEPAAFANLFNPAPAPRVATLRLPLYYAGLRGGAAVRLVWGGSLLTPTRWRVPSPSTEVLLGDYTLRLRVSMAPRSFLWCEVSPVEKVMTAVN